MAKDLLGNIVKPGDKLFLQGIVFTVKEINENRILGGKAVSQNRGIAIKIPDNLVVEADFPFDSEKPINGFVVKIPPETNAPEA